MFFKTKIKYVFLGPKECNLEKMHFLRNNQNKLISKAIIFGGLICLNLTQLRK